MVNYYPYLLQVKMHWSRPHVWPVTVYYVEISWPFAGSHIVLFMLLILWILLSRERWHNNCEDVHFNCTYVDTNLDVIYYYVFLCALSRFSSCAFQLCILGGRAVCYCLLCVQFLLSCPVMIKICVNLNWTIVIWLLRGRNSEIVQ